MTIAGFVSLNGLLSRRGPAAVPAALMLLLALAGTATFAPAAQPPDTDPAVGSPEQLALDKDDFLEKMNQAVRAIAMAVEPSVVHVAIETKVTGRRTFVTQGNGSGWVWSYGKGAAYIITNHHVIDEAPRIVVQCHDGRRLVAEIVGSDESTDIAVLKVLTDEPLVAMRRASTQSVVQGDRVYAFGSPFGFKFSMSEGIVSGLSRELSVDRNSFSNYIQCDASVNPGNSGGPLADVRGRVVGMNVAIATEVNGRGGGGGGGGGGVRPNERVSFAIPLSTIEPIVDQLVTNGSVNKGFLGVNFPLTDDQNASQLEKLNFRGSGVYVSGVLVGAPAEAGGLRFGDIITRVNGRDVANIPALRSMIAVTRPGEKIALTVWREGGTQDLAMTLIDREANRRSMEAVEEALPRFGLMKIVPPKEGDGVVLESVRAGSAAANAGLKDNYTLLAIDGKTIKSGDTLLSALSSGGFVAGKALSATVRTDEGDEKSITLKFPVANPEAEK